MKLKKLLDFPEPLGDFMAFVPGSKKQQTFPSTISYLARLILHRYAMLGILDEDGIAEAADGHPRRRPGRAEERPGHRRRQVPRVREPDADPQGRLRLLHRLRLRRGLRLAHDKSLPA